MRRFFLQIFLFSLLLPPLAAQTATSPQTVISELQTTLLSAMKQAEELGYDGRYALIQENVLDNHDLPFIAKTAVGRHWRKLSDEDQQRLVETFTRLTLATYADRFDGYSGETFSLGEQEPLSGDKVLVHSELTKGDGEVIRFDYVLRPTEDTWRIINIVVNGVSDLALKRAEYSAVISQDGIDALIARLEEQIAHYADTTTSSPE